MIQLILAMISFLPPNSPLLNETSDPICPCHIADPETQQSVDALYEKACSANIAVGLAAPQIGIQKRIILVDLAATGVFTEGSVRPTPEIKEFINPEILWQSEEKILWREGCFSVGRISGIVPRAAQILLRWYDRQGNVFTQEFSGYTARIFQHEIDHLDGIRFPDRIQNDQDLHWVELDELPTYRIHWATWNQKCPRSKWLEMKEMN